MSLYGGAKAAIRQFVRGWIQDVKGSGVRINVLSPGAVDTPSLRTALAGALGADQVDAKDSQAIRWKWPVRATTS